MKHGINLYHESFRPSQELLTSGRLILSLVLVLVSSVLALGFYEYTNAKLVSTQNKALSEQAELNNQLLELSAQLNRQRPERSLLRRTERIELDVESRRALLYEFNRRGKIRDANLSPVLKELAAIHEEGLWLTRISIQPNGVELEGHTLAAGLIPHWMAKFSSASTLASHQFSVVELRRDNREVLSFALLSKPKPDNSFSSDGNNGGLLDLFEQQTNGVELNEKLIPKI